MHVNNLGGARMPTTTSVGSSSSTARTSFSSLVQSGPATPAAGRAGIPGSNIVSTAIGISHGGMPGSGLSGPYLGTTPSTPGTQGGPKPVHTQAPSTSQAPAVTGNPGAPVGSEFNKELMQMQMSQQKQLEMKALKELAMMSLTSFVSGTFSLGQNQQKIEQESF